MPRYIDADTLKKEIELLKVLVAFARQSGKDTLNGTLLEYRKAVLKIIDEQPTDDVVPKREVEMSQHLLKDAWKRIEELGNLCGELQKAKTEVAMEFIEAVDSMLNLVCAMTGLNLTFFGKYAELKKKYTEEIYETKDSHESL